MTSYLAPVRTPTSMGFISDGMKVCLPVRFDVTTLIQPNQDNVVAVVLDPAPDEQLQVGKTSLVHTHKSRMTYWWDFCPRMIHIGIWDDVYIERTGFTGPATGEDDFKTGHVNVEIRLECDSAETVMIDTVLLKAGSEVASYRESVSLTGATTIHHHLSVSEPSLWWPNGSGPQALYELGVKVTSANGQVSDERRQRIGFREVQLVRNEGVGSDAPPYPWS